jgi:hypothetical protein
MWMCVRAISRAFTHSGLRHEDRAAPAADGLKFQSATRDYSNFLGGKTTRDHTQQQPACSAQTRLHSELITKKDNPYGASKPFGFVLNVCPKIAVRHATSELACACNLQDTLTFRRRFVRRTLPLVASACLQ